MCRPDDITLQQAVINGLKQARDAIGHRIAIETARLDRMKDEKAQQKRDELCETPL